MMIFVNTLTKYYCVPLDNFDEVLVEGAVLHAGDEAEVGVHLEELVGDESLGVDGFIRGGGGWGLQELELLGVGVAWVRDEFLRGAVPPSFRHQVAVGDSLFLCVLLSLQWGEGE